MDRSEALMRSVKDPEWRKSVWEPHLKKLSDEARRGAEHLRHAELEQRVIARTSELATANHELRENIAVRERMERSSSMKPCMTRAR